MRKIKVFIMLAAVVCIASAAEGKGSRFALSSPDGRIAVEISVADRISYTVSYDGRQAVGPSEAAMHLTDGSAWGVGSRLLRTRRGKVDERVASPLYMRDSVVDRCNTLLLEFREGFSVEFRAYDDGVAYRFSSHRGGEYEVALETARFGLDPESKLWIAYNNLTGEHNDPYFTSFENTYTVTTLADAECGRLAFTPLTVESRGVKICFAESDVENYAGMFLFKPEAGDCLQADFAPLPRLVETGGYNMLQGIVREREEYIARCSGARSFPWRIMVIADEESRIAESDIVWRLASPSRVDDTSWIRPGKVAWEWWNNCALRGVDFVTGVNMPTYKAYIDFAAANGIEYVILDEGWSVRFANDLMQVVPEIDLPALVRYADERGVGLILWAGYNAFNRDVEGVCEYYSDMGIKGFKIDFCDRDDAQMVQFHYRAAAAAALHRLVLDFHGTYKPTGLNRTYPNVLNFEGVYGLEQMKWAGVEVDHPQYDVTIPFARLVAGPADYTPGAMRNGSRDNFRPVSGEPMSQGTRCHQLAAYAVFFAPLSMLCDSPSMYERERECLDIIASVPTVWDETVVLSGSLGEYVVTARRSGSDWYVGGMTSWSARTIEVNLSPIVDAGSGCKVVLWYDGANAAAIASDYVREERTIGSDGKVTVDLAPGGGFLMHIVHERH